MSSFNSLVYDLKVLTFELSFHPGVAWTLALGHFLLSLVLRPFSSGKSFLFLSRSHLLLTRIGRHGFIAASLYRRIERVICLRVATTRMIELPESRTKVRDLGRTSSRIAGLVLKVPRYEEGRLAEKGALLLKNTDRFDFFRQSVDMRSILQRYVLILEPSWSGYSNLKLLRFTGFREDHIVVMSPYPGDYRFLKHLQSNLHPIAAGPGDWVDPRIFRPLETQVKQYDAVMVARWSLDKRHHALFRTIRAINDPSFRLALLANNVFGVDRASILRMIDRSRLGKQITVFEDLPSVEVNVVLNQSKVNVLLSRQEGGNRALFEGFFAGIPGLAFSNHVGIPTTHFVPKTGRLITPGELSNALLYFRDHWKEFEPRPWALANIAPEVTTSKLNSALKELARQRGEPWTQDIVAKCNAPDVRYYPEERVGDGFCTANELMACFPRAVANSTK